MFQANNYVHYRSLEKHRKLANDESRQQQRNHSEQETHVQKPARVSRLRVAIATILNIFNR